MSGQVFTWRRPGMAPAGLPGSGECQMSPMRVPGSGECHLWSLRVRADASPEELTEPDERAQAERFRVDSARSIFITSRLGQRQVLGRYLGVPAADVKIDRTCARCGDPRHGRPTAPLDGLEYSVSHSGEWCLIAVGGDAIGVDIERTDAITNVADLAQRTLNGFEHAEYAATGPQARTAWFYRAWARKEAAAKAVGQGLGIEMATVDVRGERTVADGVVLWLWDLDGPDGYAAALASATRLDRLLACDLGSLAS